MPRLSYNAAHALKPREDDLLTGALRAANMLLARRQQIWDTDREAARIATQAAKGAMALSSARLGLVKRVLKGQVDEGVLLVRGQKRVTRARLRCIDGEG